MTCASFSHGTFLAGAFCVFCMAEKMELRKSLRRKFSGNIRSPVVRRDSQAEVVLKGWLYKLEGATIKQWKKRWCILSEYCLFYYKGPDEEKCLGSILLPSYKIRPCTADDKVSLKHSFVAEHQNTKTYYFAAENNASMCQWMNSMSLASLMQKDTDRSRQTLPLHGMQAAANASQGIPPDYHFSPHVAPQRPGMQQPQRPSDESFEVEAYSAGAAPDGHYLGSGDQYPCSYTRSPIYDQRPPPAAPRQRPCYPVYANAPPKPLRHGATSPNVAEGGGYDACNSYEGYDFYGAQEPLPAYAGRPVSAHYGENVPNSTLTSTQLMRPRSADFLERDDDGEEPYFSKKSAPAVAAKPRPKSSMAHYDWEDEDEAHDWRGQQQQQQWRSRTMETVPQAGAFHDESQMGRMPSAKAVSASGNSAQSKKAAHKEQSMKRLLEWKQRMLQSPLCKKPGQQQQQQQYHHQQHVVPSPQELQSAVLRKTPVPESSQPPERPPLPEEYRRRASEGSRPMDGMPGGHFFNTEPRGEPVGRAQESSAPPGPDLIQHAKMSPSRYSDSPDYVNLRNLRCDPEFYHEKQSQSYTPPVVQSQKPLRSCLSQSSGDRRPLPAQHEQAGTDWNQPSSKVDQSSTGLRGEISSFSHRHDSHSTIQSRAFSPFEKAYANEVHSRSYTEAHDKPCTEDNRSNVYDTAYVHSDRQLSPTNILVQRGNQNAAASSQINRGKTAQLLHEQFTEARQTSYSSPGSSLPRHQNDESAFLEEKSLLQGRQVTSPHGSTVRDSKGVLRHHNTRLSSDDRATDRDSSLSRSDQGLSSPRPDVPQERLYGNADMWLHKNICGSSRTSLRAKNTPQDEEAFYIKKEDYYKASQMFYPKQPASKTLLGSVSDLESSGSGAAEMETFDSRYRRISATPKSPQWEIDKDVGLPVPDNLDLSFQSTSNNSVFEASCECQTPGDQSPELFQGTLRPNRTYVRDRQPSKSPMHLSKDLGNDTEATEVKTPVGNSSFEEMRAAYQKKKEAPPVNIVQDRIKCFEPKDEKSPNHGESVRESWEAAEQKQIGDRNASSSCNNESPQDIEFRTRASDAEKIDSLAKYGSTSILASLHRSAELNREGAQHTHGDQLREEQVQKPDTVLFLRHCPQEPPPCSVQSKPPEAHYLPMGWLTSEADYVSMNVDLSPGCSLEEPVYNEPVLPVTSYAHESYGKSSLACQILKSESSGSSSNGSAENIYEQVQQTSEDLHAMPYHSNGNSVQSKRESPPVYEEPYRLAPSQPESKSPEKPKSHELYMKDGCKQLVKKAIPDLLHHEEVKDSGASDADDEASRADFDTATSSLPSYQKEILNDHLSSVPLRSPAQPYLPVYTSHTTKYSFKKERKPDDATSVQSTDAFKEPEKRSPSQHSKFVSFAGTATLTNSKMNPDAFVKVSSYQSENRPTSIGLLKSLDGETSSSEAGSSLTSSVVKTSSADASLRSSSTQGNFSQISSPLLSTAPDVLPSEVRSVVSECNSNKVLNSSNSSSSAPYYYSDIFGDKLGSAFGSSAARPASQQSRATPNMLNNTRDVTSMSPHSKDHVGRKVNKISTPQAGLGVSHTRTLSEPQSTADLESTLRGLLHPANTRKFSDAERNKYVAGHTLEKTSHMSRSVLCHMRSKQAAETSQPISKECDPPAHHSEESAGCRSPGRMLPRRLSRSLEDIIDSSPAEHVSRSKTPVIPTCCQDEPYYENVGFGSARAQAPPSKALSGASPQVSPAKHSVYDGEDLCREFVAASVLSDPLGILRKSTGQLPAEKQQKTAACSSDFMQMGSLSASLGSLKLSSPERQEAPFYSSCSPQVETGKRCWSNDFPKTAAQGDLHRHSIDNLHTRGMEVQPKNSPERASQPTSPSSPNLSHSISAGDLLGKSHEELVLLLIQLRRSQSNLLSCQLQCKEELQELKQKLVQSGTQSSAADVQRLVGLQRSLNELTRNLDLTQPLISLVENMVKLGSLYTVAGISKQHKRMDEGEDYRYEDTYAETLEAETLEKQQLLIEKEILHIQNMLAESTSCGSPLKDDLEVELKRLQKIVNDLLQKKSKASMPPNAYMEKEPQVKAKPPEPKHSPTGSVPERKRHQKTYYETDLDSSVTSNLALDSRPTSLCDIVTTSQVVELESPSFSPEPSDMAEDRSYVVQDISKADDRTKKFYGLLPRDRAQEIKTVRIVKRESERRNKGKERRKGGLDDSCPWLAEEGDSAETRTPDTTVLTYESSYETKKPAQDSSSSEGRSASSSSSAESMSSGQRTPVKNESRRNKRRHYTISGSHPFLEQHSPPKMPAGLRSRDDMDMERCLRTVNTPDIVRSTIKKSEVFDEQTIDMQIGLPQKILIPERYIEVESENVSAVEQLRRSLKAANIRKMLTETVGYEDLGARGSVEALRSKVGEEKRRRAHLLALSHTIAKEVMERSKMVAAHVSYQENT
ncbi:LOW QUALITY PROTEIN: uncharacterized protein LOC119450369 [Dermacentor silvarum]|nr:LOW QUALITY PROTEIN: uncharacterized protein LOC119450369 [Dermacentor silvarum]